MSFPFRYLYVNLACPVVKLKERTNACHWLASLIFTMITFQFTHFGFSFLDIIFPSSQRHWVPIRAPSAALGFPRVDCVPWPDVQIRSRALSQTRNIVLPPIRSLKIPSMRCSDYLSCSRDPCQLCQLVTLLLKRTIKLVIILLYKIKVLSLTMHYKVITCAGTIHIKERNIAATPKPLTEPPYHLLPLHERQPPLLVL